MGSINIVSVDSELISRFDARFQVDVPANATEPPVQMGAFDHCVDEDPKVILLDTDFKDGQLLRAALQAKGLQVFLGPDIGEASTEPVIMLQACNRNLVEVALRLEAVRKVFPVAPICYVTKSISSASVPSLNTASSEESHVEIIGFIFC